MNKMQQFTICFAVSTLGFIFSGCIDESLYLDCDREGCREQVERGYIHSDANRFDGSAYTSADNGVSLEGMWIVNSQLPYASTEGTRYSCELSLSGINPDQYATDCEPLRFFTNYQYDPATSTLSKPVEQISATLSVHFEADVIGYDHIQAIVSYTRDTGPTVVSRLLDMRRVGDLGMIFGELKFREREVEDFRINTPLSESELPAYNEVYPVHHFHETYDSKQWSFDFYQDVYDESAKTFSINGVNQLKIYYDLTGSVYDMATMTKNGIEDEIRAIKFFGDSNSAQSLNFRLLYEHLPRKEPFIEKDVKVDLRFDI